MGRATGLGGVFFKWKQPKESTEWYRRHLHIIPTYGNASSMVWREFGEQERLGSTVWSPFALDTTYFSPGTAPFMLNFRVEDLDGLLADLKAARTQIEAGCARADVPSLLKLHAAQNALDCALWDLAGPRDRGKTRDPPRRTS